MGERIYSVRGAVQLSEDTAELMSIGVCELVEGILTKNSVPEANIIHVLFTQTLDLTNENPARALRKGGGFSHTPLFCSSEPEYPDSLPRTVRVLVSYYHRESHVPRPLYLHGAELLRLDLGTTKSR
ncbi:MAG: chorismate mutase [Spirochaetales bacterium]|nr:chorismate mutase [Spirochaetales bacterium]